MTDANVVEQVVALRDDPEALEQLFRSGRDQFTAALPVALESDPHSILLRA